MVLGKIYSNRARNNDKSRGIGVLLYPYTCFENSTWEINVSATDQELADQFSFLQSKSWATASLAKAEVESLFPAHGLTLDVWEESESELKEPPPGRLPR